MKQKSKWSHEMLEAIAAAVQQVLSDEGEPTLDEFDNLLNADPRLPEMLARCEAGARTNNTDPDAIEAHVNLFKLEWVRFQKHVVREARWKREAAENA